MLTTPARAIFLLCAGEVAVYIRYNADFHDFTCKFNTKYLFS